MQKICQAVYNVNGMLCVDILNLSIACKTSPPSHTKIINLSVISNLMKAKLVGDNVGA